MAPTIRVDDDVYAQLQTKAEAFVDTPNSVLRRLLDLDQEQSLTTANPAPSGERVRNRAGGKLSTMLSNGVLRVDEPLVWARRDGQLTGQVTADGRIQLPDGTTHDTPSSAAKHLAGYEVNGWRVWRRARGNRSLHDLWVDSGHGSPSPHQAAAVPARPSVDLPARRVTPQKDFRPHILAVLREAGGVEQIDKVLAELEQRMEHLFVEGDYGPVSRGEIRWRNAARWERKDMLEDGLIKESAREGVWELTVKGMS